MSMLLLVCIWACVVLIAGSLLAMVFSAVRTARSGKAAVSSTLLIAAPLAVSAIAALALGHIAQGVIVACIITLALALLAVVASGLRGFWTD